MHERGRDVFVRGRLLGPTRPGLLSGAHLDFGLRLFGRSSRDPCSGEVCVPCPSCPTANTTHSQRSRPEAVVDPTFMDTPGVSVYLVSLRTADTGPEGFFCRPVCTCSFRPTGLGPFRARNCSKVLRLWVDLSENPVFRRPMVGPDRYQDSSLAVVGRECTRTLVSRKERCRQEWSFNRRNKILRPISLRKGIFTGVS